MNSLQTIKRILSADVLVEIPEDRMGLDDQLREGYGMDSLGFVELRVRCEEVFGVEIEDGALAGLMTLGDVLALVERLARAQHSTAGA
ncbi:acyl carrier protein [Lentzea chajnantorensis]